MEQPQQNPRGEDKQAWESEVFPCVYRLRVRGRINDHAQVWFQGMDVTVDETHSPPETIVREEVLDLAQLYGLIGRMRDLGMTLVSVERVE